MKKTYTVTFFTCAVVIAVVLAAVLSFHKSESKTLKVGFIYVGDASTSYTNNFIEVQNAITDKYGKQVTVYVFFILFFLLFHICIVI